jgi:hypothetical protein
MFKWLFLLLCLSSFGWSQSTTCVENSGKPCPEWLHKLIGQYPPVPDYREAQAIRYASFFTFNKDTKAALHPDKKSWGLFIGAHAAGALAFAIDHHVTHGARETNGSEIPAIAGVAALDFVMFKCVSPSLSVEAPMYEVQHYWRDAVK